MIAPVIYNLVTFPLSLMVGLLFCFHPRGRHRLAERFACWDRISEPLVWLHGASVGEVNGLLELVPGLRDRYPDCSILLTATSTTGLERAHGVVDHEYLMPFDCSVWLEPLLRKLNVRLLIFGETEIWPAFLNGLLKRKVPVYMVNATISDFTVRSYRLLVPLLRPILRRLHGVAAANESSQKRLLELGVPEKLSRVTGSTKYDRMPMVATEAAVAALQKSYFEGDEPIITLGSIRPGEEAYWMEAIKESVPAVRWILAPRHKEKFSFFASTLEQQEVAFSLWSETVAKGMQSKAAVLLLDTMGKLEECYSFSQLAFIGATLVPGIGGHNPLEAAQYGVAIVLGEHYKNAQVVVDEMRDLEACVCVSSAEEIMSLVRLVQSREKSIAQLGERAKKVAEANRGATERVFSLIDRGVR